MKKITLLTAFVTICLFAFAQTKMAQLQHMPLSKKVKSISQLGAANPVSKPASITSNGAMYAKKAVVWSEDFAGGFPGTWTMTDVTGTGGWAYTFQGSQGQYVAGWGADDAISSTTSSNGFMIMDADLQNPGSPPFLDLEAYFTTDAIDLSLYPAVNLVFQHYFLYFTDGELVISVSNDGVNFTEWDVTGGYGVQDLSQNPLTVNINISSIAGGQSTVYIRFHWRGTSHYMWQIDDIEIIETPDNDLVLVTDSDMVYLDPWLVPIYGQIPIYQTGTTNFAILVANNGATTQSNVVLNVDVNDGVSSVFNSSDTLPSLASGNVSLITITQGFSPNGTGTHTITFTVSSDSTDAIPADNTTSISYDVTDTVFARDDNDVSAGVYYLKVSSYGLSGPTANGSSYEFGNWYETVNADTAISISVVFGANTVVNTTIKGKIYAQDGTTLLGETDWYNIQVGDVGTFPNFPTVTIPLLVPVFLGDTSNYVVTIADYSGTDTAMTIVATKDGHVYATSFLMYSAGLASIVETPFVRLNVIMPSDPCIITPLSATVSTTDASCDSADGTATVAISSGTPTYTYLWNTSPSQDSITATGLASGTYTVIVTDGITCQVVISNITISNTGGASVDDTTIISPLCNGNNNGSITLTVSGAGPFSYLWDCSGSTSNQASNLPADTCIVIITDTALCETIETYIVTEPAIITANTSSTPDTLGNGVGTATVTPGGGTGSYTYLWDDSLLQTTPTAVGLSAGDYTVEVTDANGCTGNSPFIVTVDSVGIVGLMELSGEVSFNIYPNPTNGQFIVEFNNQKKDDYLIEVRNIIGQLIYSEEIDIAREFTTQIDLSEHRGVYFLSISNSSGTRTEKLIVY